MKLQENDNYNFSPTSPLEIYNVWFDLAGCNNPVSVSQGWKNPLTILLWLVFPIGAQIHHYHNP